MMMPPSGSGWETLTKAVTNPKMILGDYNEAMMRRLLVVLEEVAFAANKAAQYDEGLKGQPNAKTSARPSRVGKGQNIGARLPSLGCSHSCSQFPDRY